MTANIDGMAKAALEAILATSQSPEGEDSTELFTTHHLAELSEKEWERAIGIPSPTAEQILSNLTLESAWDSEDNNLIDTFDFTLPNGVTDYLLSVRFKDGHPISVAMES